MKETTHRPLARTDDLVINELTDEVLVYDRQRDKALCLNAAAASVWKQCDGHSTVAEIAGKLSRQTADGRSRRPEPERGSSPTAREGSEIEGQRSDVRDQSLSEQVVWLALEQLSRDHLLEERVTWPASIPRMSRREAIRLAGIGAIIALPIVVSITAPTPALAGTCRSKNASCSTGSECCSKACIASKCA
jgi:hypothetical protein